MSPIKLSYKRHFGLWLSNKLLYLAQWVDMHSVDKFSIDDMHFDISDTEAEEFLRAIEDYCE